MIVAWLLFPLLVAALCLGAGLLTERASGLRVPGVLLLPLGFLTLIVLVELVTHLSWTAPLATPVVIVAPIAGYLCGWARLRASSPDPWPIAAALAVFAVFAAPVVLSGEPTFAGYLVLGDTSVHFVLIDRLLEHGHTTSGLVDSSYRDTIDAYLDSGYPFGAQGLLGAMRPLTGQDIAWIYQPYLAMIVALVSLSLYSIATAISSRPARALAAFVAAQPALVYSFSLQGSIKELATLTALATTVALVPQAIRPERTLRGLIPLAVATVACLEVLGLAIAPWLAPLLAVSLGAMIWQARGRHEGRRIVRKVIVFAAGVALLALPVLITAKSFLDVTTEVVTTSSEFGNLLGPLHKQQILGVWLGADYRDALRGSRESLTHLLMAVVALSAIGGAIWAARKRAWPPLMFAAVSLLGSAIAINRGSPWVDAKALMIGSSCILLAAMIAAGALIGTRWRVLGVLLAATITASVLWSNALAYRATGLAPRERMTELDRIGQRLDGKGPTLYNEFDEYDKHFLREGDPTGWSESFGPPGRSGSAFGEPMRLGQIPYSKIAPYRTLVVRRSPLADRPPAPYQLTYRGRYYEVWTRDSTDRERVVAEYSAQDGPQPGAIISCDRLQSLSRRGPTLAYAERSPAAIVDLEPAAVAAGWRITENRAPRAIPPPGGRIEQSFRLPKADRYQVWLEGSVSRSLTVSLDGRALVTIENQLNQHGQLIELGSAQLARGPHSVELRSDGRSLEPGSDFFSEIGSLVLSGEHATVAVQQLPARQWRKLCGRELDWVEVLQGK